MKIYPVQPIGFASNSYILTADDRSAVLIDCAQPRILQVCQKLRLTPEYVLLTHCHFDHIGGLQALYDAGCKVCCSQEESKNLFSEVTLLPMQGLPLPQVKVHKTFSDGERTRFCGMEFEAISTPGHTSGGMCYAVENHLFTGDTLFKESIGRTDFPTGNFSQLLSSLKKLCSLPGNYTVHCGHEADTSLEHERLFNPYVR